MWNALQPELLTNGHTPYAQDSGISTAAVAVELEGAGCFGLAGGIVRASPLLSYI